MKTNKKKQWRLLSEHFLQLKNIHLRKLFLENPGRAEQMTLHGAGLFLDYSKNRIVDKTVSLLLDLAREADLEAEIEHMFS
ncbi:MAG: glucose-6-phosphate isomerase, partial [Deltaproteobacteria bacterium]|nr:glucose-6-phosphate isomerase [Deltaproteobacteria bacterium]